MNLQLFDCRWAGAHGIGRFSESLLLRLPDFQGVTLGGSPSAPMDPWRLSFYLRKVKPVLYFSPGYNAPSDACCRFAFTLHDLNHVVVSESTSRLKQIYYSKIVLPAMKRAAAIFTVSEFSRIQILEWSGVEESKLVTIRQGVEKEFGCNGSAFDCLQPYFLYVGNHRPHKNLVRAITAFATSGLAGDFRFLITGKPGQSLKNLVTRLKLQNCVQFVKATTDVELASLYRGARALIFVSIYEGFGRPIIESMACGTPVVTSNRAAMPEVSGGAALLVDPFRIENIAEKMRIVAMDDTLRNNLRQLGLKQVAHFNWDDAATKIRETLRQRI